MRFFRERPDIDGALYLVRQLLNLTMPMRGMPISVDSLNSLNFIVGETLSLLRQQEGPGSDQGTVSYPSIII